MISHLGKEYMPAEKISVSALVAESVSLKTDQTLIDQLCDFIIDLYLSHFKSRKRKEEKQID